MSIVKYHNEEAWSVPSSTEPGKRHRVTLSGCDCKGFYYRGGCSHLDLVLANLAGIVEEDNLVELLEKSIEMTKKSG